LVQRTRNQAQHHGTCILSAVTKGIRQLVWQRNLRKPFEQGITRSSALPPRPQALQVGSQHSPPGHGLIALFYVKRASHHAWLLPRIVPSMARATKFQFLSEIETCVISRKGTAPIYISQSESLGKTFRQYQPRRPSFAWCMARAPAGISHRIRGERRDSSARAAVSTLSCAHLPTRLQALV